MGWALWGVTNACIMVLVIMASGYAFSHYKLIISERFMPQVNSLMLLICFPAFNLYFLGITLDLQQASAWKCLAAYIMWISIIQICIVAYIWILGKGGIGEAALLNLVLTANNTVIIGLPVVESTFGAGGGEVSLLTVLPIFLQIIPFSIIAFEMERWLVHDSRSDSDTGSAPVAGGSLSWRESRLQAGGQRGVLNQGPARDGQIFIPMLPRPSSSNQQARAMPEADLQSEGEGEGEGSGSQSGGDVQSHWGQRCARSSQGSLDDDEIRSNVASWISATRGESAPLRPMGVTRGGGDHPLLTYDDRDTTGEEDKATAARREDAGRVRLLASDLEIQDRHSGEVHGNPSGSRLDSTTIVRPRCAGRRAPSVTVALLTRPRWHHAYLRMHRDYEQGVDFRRMPSHRQPYLAAVDIPIYSAFAQLHVDTPRSSHGNALSQDEARRAAKNAIAGHGGILKAFRAFLQRHAKVFHLILIIIENPMLWSILLALTISASGLRVFLDPACPQYIQGLGWIRDTLRLMANITVPLALFSAGIWMCGKKLSTQPRRLATVLALKFIASPALQIFCAKVCQLDMVSAMSLVLLSVTPSASSAFVIAAKYEHDVELVTLVTIIGTVLLLPLTLIYLYLPRYIGVWDYDLSNLGITNATSN